MRPLRASDRKLEYSAGHDEIECRAIQSTSMLGSHGSRCAPVGQPDAAPLSGIAHAHRTQPDHAGGDPQRSDRHRPAGMLGAGAPPVHEQTPPCRSATLSQKRYVDDLAGADLLRLTGNHDQTVCLGQRRQQVRRGAGRAAQAPAPGIRRCPDRASSCPRRKPLRPATEVIGDSVRACTIRRIGCRLPSDNRISGRTITSKTTSALTGFAGNRNVGTPSRPNCPKPWTEPGCIATRVTSISPSSASTERTPSAAAPPTAPAITTISARLI